MLILLQITPDLLKLRLQLFFITNYDKVLQIATAITNFHKIITNYAVLQITTKQTCQLQTWQVH